MSRIPYTNNSDKPVYIGGVLVPAGGTRTVDANLAPVPNAAKTPAPRMEDGPDPTALNELLDNDPKALIEALPRLGVEELDHLLRCEREGKNRPFVIEQVELARLERLDWEEGRDDGDGTTPAPGVDHQQLLDGKVDDVVAALPGLASGDLEELIKLEAVGKNRTTLIKQLEQARDERVAAEQGDQAAE